MWTDHLDRLAELEVKHRVYLLLGYWIYLFSIDFDEELVFSVSS